MKKLLLIFSIIGLAACDSTNPEDKAIGPQDCPTVDQVDLGKPSTLVKNHGVFNASLILDISLGNSVEGVPTEGVEYACALWRADYDGDGIVTDKDASAYFHWYMNAPTVNTFHAQECPGIVGDIDMDGITSYDVTQIKNIANNTINVRTVYPETYECVIWRADFDGDLAVELEDGDKLLNYLEN